MGQGERKVNIGRFVAEMQWFQPIENKTDSGFVREEYNPGRFFLSEIKSEAEVVEKGENEITKKTKITFIAWRNNVTTDWKVMYNGVKYDITSINYLERGLYAEYNAVSE